MTVQDLPELHRRYVDLAGRFKAAWTYHQFLQGLQKLFSDLDLPRYPTDLAEIHVTLKKVSEGLTQADAPTITLHLDRVARQLDQTLAILAAADTRVTPPLLRQFFDRVKNYDDQILAQMVRFYLGLAAEEGLAGDRLDKVDFLATKLSEETDQVTGAVVLRDRARLRSIFSGFWSQFEGLTPDPAWIEERKTEIAAFRREIQNITDLDALATSQIVARYRDVKKLLGRYLFQPEVLLAAVETNLQFKNRVKQNFQAEEQRILDESAQILKQDDTGPASDTRPDLSEFRRTLEDVERKQKSSNLKVDDLALLRRQIDELRPRLARKPPSEAVSATRGETESEHQLDDALRPHFDELVAALEGTDNRATPKEAALSRDLFPYRIEAREVTAYRRLYVAAEGDRALERFLLESAALRQRVSAEATEISEILDETMVTRDAPIFERARRTTRAAESYVNRFGQYLDAAVQQTNFSEAQELQLLRMRLIRDYSGLWLLVHRPSG
jgi:hypothetical protein